MSRRKLLLILLASFCFVLCSCTLARPENQIKGNAMNSRGEFCGVWVVSKNEKSDRLDPNGFKNKDSVVVLLKETTDEGEVFEEIEEQGVKVNTTSEITDNGNNCTYEGTVYTKPKEGVYYQLIPLYKKSDGSVYSSFDGGTASITSESDSSISYEEKIEVKINEEKKQETRKFIINFKIAQELKECNLVFLDKNFSIIKTQNINLKTLNPKKEEISILPPKGWETVLIQEKQKDQYGRNTSKYTSYGIDDINKKDELTVGHEIVLPNKGSFGKVYIITFKD